ncbi:MAG TPA: PaaI family thioesterase [Polyangiaceae bacterium]|nr:PaaI family thioesterase [Polyangiaceae bacterium]
MQAPEWPNRSHYSDLIGLRLEHREDGAAQVSVEIAGAHCNTNGTAHGGVVTSLVDTACGAAMAYQPSIGGNGVATVSIQVSYLAPVFVGDVLTAASRCRGRGRRLLTMDAEVKNQKGEVVAIGICTLRVRSSGKVVSRGGNSDPSG